MKELNSETVELIVEQGDTVRVDNSTVCKVVEGENGCEDCFLDFKNSLCDKVDCYSNGRRLCLVPEYDPEEARLRMVEKPHEILKDVNCTSVKELADLYKAALERIDDLASIKPLASIKATAYKTFIAYRTNRAIGEEPVTEVDARSLDEAVVALKKKQKEVGESTMWTVYEGEANWMSIRGIVMTVITCKGTIIQHFMA